MATSIAVGEIVGMVGMVVIEGASEGWMLGIGK